MSAFVEGCSGKDDFEVDYFAVEGEYDLYLIVGS